MGLGNGVHWIAWFINSSALMLITILLLVAVLKGGKILWHSNPVIIFLFMFAFMLATITLCFLISVFFSRANLAAACGGIIFFLTYLPYVLVRWFEEYMSTGHKVLAVRLIKIPGNIRVGADKELSSGAFCWVWTFVGVGGEGGA